MISKIWLESGLPLKYACRLPSRILFSENERIRGVVELSGLDADVEMEDMLEGKGFLMWHFPF